MESLMFSIFSVVCWMVGWCLSHICVSYMIDKIVFCQITENESCRKMWLAFMKLTKLQNSAHKLQSTVDQLTRCI